MKIEGEFYDGTKVKGEVPLEASTASPIMLGPWSDGPGIRVGVIGQGATVSFSECSPDCDGKNESYSEYIGDGTGRIIGTFHFHSNPR